MVTYCRILRPIQGITQHRWWVIVSLILILKCRASNMENINKADDPANTSVECPAISENSACPCYKFEDGELNSCSKLKFFWVIVGKSKRSLFEIPIRFVLETLIWWNIQIPLADNSGTALIKHKSHCFKNNVLRKTKQSFLHDQSQSDYDLMNQL